MRFQAVRPHIGLIAFLSFALLLGGASAAGHLANLALQWVAIAIIAWCLAVPGVSPDRTLGRTPWLFVLAIALLFVVQLAPLPPSVWSALPGRDVVAEGFRLAGLEQPWLPLSLAPARTVGSALALLPALAALLLTARLRDPARSLPAVILAFALISIVLGVAQVANGASSPLYVYDITNRGLAVGFFANRNHLATLALVALPCIALLARGESGGERRKRVAMGTKLAYGAAFLFILFGLVMSRSDAGLLLALPVALVSLLIYRNVRIGPLALTGAVALVFAGLVGAAAWSGQESLLPGTSEDFHARSNIYPATAKLVAQYLPLGSGIGSFIDVYKLQEDPSVVTLTYVNHAHNDFLEVALETGVAGMALVAAFLLWWGWMTLRVWNGTSAAAKAASAVTGIIIVHSAVDYPLRTAAIMTIFAAFCAVMAAVPKKKEGAAPPPD